MYARGKDILTFGYSYGLSWKNAGSCVSSLDSYEVRLKRPSTVVFRVILLMTSKLDV